MGPTVGWQGGSLPGAPVQLRAVQPVYVGCVQFAPPLNEKYTPESPTPCVNGQEVSLPALQASRSISSFTPEATMLGLMGLIARPGSFCLLRGKGEVGLPTVTSASILAAITETADNRAMITAHRRNIPRNREDFISDSSSGKFRTFQKPCASTSFKLSFQLRLVVPVPGPVSWRACPRSRCAVA